MAASSRLILAALVGLATATDAATRVALVSTCGGDAAGNVIALAEAKLAGVTNIVLVERAEVERILAEQKLVHCGLSDSAQALAVGKLLGVEAFATLETFPGAQETLGLVVFDARSGAKLWDAVLPAGGVDATAEGSVFAVRAACEKRLWPASDRRTVCLLSVRNAELPRAMDSFCESVGRLLERGLVGSASLAVLERERLEQINRERALQATETPADLLPSLTLLELEFSRGAEKNDIKATVFLTDAAGASLGTLDAIGKTEQIGDLVELLLQKSAQFLRAAPVREQANLEHEAARFEEEAKFWAEHSRIDLAATAAEAAFALNPNQKAFRDTLASYLVGYAGQLVSANVERSVALAGRAMDLSEAIQAEGSDPNTEGGLFGYLYRSNFPTSCDPECRERIRALKERHWQMCETIADRAFASGRQVTGVTVPWMYGRILTRRLDGVPSDAHFRRLVKRWMETVGMCGLERNPSLSATMKVFSGREVTVDSWMPRDAGLMREMDEVFQVIREHTHPVIQLYGMYGEIWAETETTNAPPEQVRRQVSEFVERARQLIRDSPGEQGATTRYLCYLAALDAMDLVDHPGARSQLFQELFDFMLSQKDLVPYVCWAATDTSIGDRRADWTYWPPTRPISRTEYPRLINNCDRILAAFDSPDIHRLDGGGEFRHVFRKVAIEAIRAGLRQEIGDATAVVQAPWQNARLLYNLKDSQIRYLTVEDDAAYVLINIRSQISGKSLRRGLNKATPLSPFVDTLKLVRITFSAGQREGLGSIELPATEVRACSFGEGFVLVATADEGVVILSVDGKSAKRISMEDGLPSDYAHSVAIMNGTLYLGLGQSGHDAYLATYEMRTGRSQIIASSRRKEKLTPFDDVSPPYYVRAIIPDPSRKRQLFVTDFGDDINNHNDYNPLIGIWEYSTEQKSFKQLTRFYRTSRWVGPLSDDALLLAPCAANPWQPERRYRPWCGVVSFDLRDNASNVICAQNRSDAGPHVPVTASAIVSEYAATPPCLLLNGWLWSGGNWRRFSTDGKRTEALPPLTADGIDPVRRLQWLERVPRTKQVLAADAYTIWLLTLEEDASKVTP